MTQYETVEVSVENRTAEILLSREDTLNALNDVMISELFEAFSSVQQDDEVYSIVISGKGRAFSSGADVSDMDDREENYPAHKRRMDELQGVIRGIYRSEKPVVAAVNGPALGAGSDLTLAADFRILSENAFLREQFVNIGLNPGDGGVFLLSELIGTSRAKQYIFTGEDISPEDALDMGLAVDVVPEGDALTAAHEFAADLNRKPQVGINNTKRLFYQDQSIDEHLETAAEYLWECMNDPEQAEAVRALLEDREPEYDR